ncbi:PIR Superfamily Protein [Plasmodium ovale curtisi]|uniref:PIR Superfamily Protein n=1 Tax=Plasmodium ovale curtisi TaxID=864141 RepID=A0A1A8WMU8_PLAOA|nr:PIR Superfamily Protein [Plasmodium ovale curtisi]
MPEDNAKFDLAFYNKLTEDTLSANNHLKEYYDKIESIYNDKYKILHGKHVEVADHEATRDDQGSESDTPFHNQTYNIFLSKFADSLGKLIYHDYDSSLLQHDHSKQCVYFKYWFYDKILKNIFSNEKLKDFYEEIKEGDEEDKSVCEADEEQYSNDTGELIEKFFEQEEEEEDDDDIVQASSEDSYEDDMSEDENQHICKDGECCNKKILLSLGKSNSCNIYKLKLNQIRDIKLLYDYLEDDKSKNSSSAKEKISKSTYCSTFNKTIEVYNDESKCKSNDIFNEYCREVEECRKNYSLTNISILGCAEAESTSSTLEQAVDRELEGERPPSFPSERGAGSDSTTSSLSVDLSDTNPEILKGVGFTYFLISPDSTEMGSTVLHNANNMNEKQTFGDSEANTVSGHPNTQIASTDMTGSHSMGSEASTSCNHGSVGISCGSSLQQLSAMSTESRTKLNIGKQENTENHDETEVGLQEETGNTNTIVSSASSVLGVSALAFMLYKFTPLGSLINNRRGGIDTWDINEEPYDENLLFSSALGNTNSNNNKYSIGYYSLGNT